MYLSLVIAKKEVGVVGKRGNAKTLSCFTCNGEKGSKNCLHIRVFNEHDSEDEMDELEKEFAIFDIDGNPKQNAIKKEINVNQGTEPQKMDWPINQEFQKLFRESEELQEDLVPEHNESIKCGHGNSFSSDNPVLRGQIFTSRVKLYCINYRPLKNRKIYFRPTISDSGTLCNCLQIWTGILHLNSCQ